MKKNVFSLLLALCMTLAAVLAVPPPASALFEDISDAETAAAAESLRLMGVMEGFADGTFHPDDVLNRAQFCKMVINLTGADKDLGRYTTVTVFPDVKPSYWAAPYINLAARGAKIIAGYADGSFHPERPVTLGQASAILLRQLGYKDENVGGVWPDGYVALAESDGLLDGVGNNGGANLTRAQAARLFVNLIRADTAGGSPFFALSDETTFSSLDGGAGQLVTPEKRYDMEKPVASSTLVGTRGQVVLKGEKALTFLPREAVRATAGSTGAVLVSGNASTQGFAALTGNRSGYSIYKNGLPAGVGDLRSGDVATWSADTNSVLVCDTRVTAYYETCSPGPANPSTIEILGGTEFVVLSTAVDSVSKCRPGQIVTFYLTADGRIAGAVDGSRGGNALAVVGADGTRLLCGGTELKLNCSAPADAGPVVRISTSDKGDITYTRLRSNVSGDLDIEARSVGASKLADNVRIYDGSGAEVALKELDRSRIPANEITGSRTNWAGNVDVLVLNGDPAAKTHYGIAVSRSDRTAVTDRNGVPPDSDGWVPTYSESQPTLAVECADGTIGPMLNLIGDVRSGTFIAVRLNRAGDRYTSIRTLYKLENISNAAWVGKTAVSVGGTTYTVSEDVPCYNRDNKRWITLEQAQSYAERANLYVLDGAVRIVEVRTN